MTLFNAVMTLAMTALVGNTALAQECSILASAGFKDTLRETVRSELATQGVKVLFVDEVGAADYESPFEEVPEYINVGQNFRYIYTNRSKNLPTTFLGELYTSASHGVYNMTTITEFTFGLAQLQDCRFRFEGDGACKAVLVEKGIVYERVTAQSTRDLIVAGGELNNVRRDKASMEEVRSYLRELSPRLCK